MDGFTLKNSLISAANLLERHRTLLNEMNVFPVPDGDTGANMSITMSVAKGWLKNLPDTCTAKEAASTAAAAMLRGSRGNSGAILALLFRGFARELSGLETVTADDLVRGLECGVKTAYDSVLHPMEGTILTVAKKSTAQARLYLKRNPGAAPSAVWDRLTEEADNVLSRTPYLLPVLEEAGVVDAGAKGFCLLMEGMSYTFSGKGIFPEMDSKRSSLDHAFVFMEESVTGDHGTDIAVTYRISFEIQKDGKEKSCEEISEQLHAIGQNGITADYGGKICCRVFTDDPGLAFEAALCAGTLLSFEGSAHSLLRKITFRRVSDSALQVQNHTAAPQPPESFSYCTEFSVLKDAGDCSTAMDLRNFLAALGDSAIVADGDDMVKCHVHTNHPNRIFHLPLQTAYLADIKVEKLSDRRPGLSSS